MTLFTEATALATAARRVGFPDARAPAPLIAIDQGEELFAAENEAESHHFLEQLAALLRAPPSDVDPYVLVTIRADSVETLLQRWPALGLETPESHYLAPLATSAYRDVIVQPAQVFSKRVRRLTVEPALVDQLGRDAHGADALPLLAFTLEKLFYEFGADGELTLARYIALGGIGGSIDRALAQAQRQAAAGGTDERLCRLILPGLATWDPLANAAKRLVAQEVRLTGGTRADLAPLADALVANRLLTRGGGTLEVAHEALLRRPPIDRWLDDQKDALKLRDDVLNEAKGWVDGGCNAESLVRRGARLDRATALLADPDFASALTPANDYLTACLQLETLAARRTNRGRALVTTLLLATIAGLVGVIEKEPIGEYINWFRTVRPYMMSNIRPYVLTAERERALNPRDTFRECAADCPEMVVIPAGRFLMGSPPDETGRFENEGPQHQVVIEKPFAVSRFAVTFDDWDACAAYGDCPQLGDSSFGRGSRPVINVTWHDAHRYAAWLSRATGKRYRLLTESEWEYAARAGTTTRFSFGGDDSKADQYAWYSANAGSRTQDVGGKLPNAFGLYDMNGNVWQWVEDCYGAYTEQPSNGGAKLSGDCSRRVVRGGSWYYGVQQLRSGIRDKNAIDNRFNSLGFRLGRTLSR